MTSFDSSPTPQGVSTMGGDYNATWETTTESSTPSTQNASSSSENTTSLDIAGWTNQSEALYNMTSAITYSGEASSTLYNETITPYTASTWNNTFALTHGTSTQSYDTGNFTLPELFLNWSSESFLFDNSSVDVSSLGNLTINVTMASANGSNGDLGDSGPMSMSIYEALLFALTTSLAIGMTIIGNILVILSVFTYRPLKNVQNFFIVSLAAADMAVAILVMPFNVANFIIGHWVFGVIFCHMWLTFDILTCTASILNLCAIAMDRYYAIHDPINYAQKRTFKRVLVSIVLVWAISAVISIPPLLGWNNKMGGLYNNVTGQCMLTDEKSYVVYSAMGSFYIPLFIMTFVYVNIFRATRARLRQRRKATTAAHLATVIGKDATSKTTHTVVNHTHTENSTESPEDTHEAACDGCNAADKDAAFKNKFKKEDAMKFVNNSNNDKDNNVKSQFHQFLEEKQRISLSKERRAARTMGIIMGVFVLCWLPFFLMYVIFPFCPSCANTDQRVINFIVWLGYVNSTLNPIIYTIFNIDFRRAFKKLLLGRCTNPH